MCFPDRYSSRICGKDNPMPDSMKLKLAGVETLALLVGLDPNLQPHGAIHSREVAVLKLKSRHTEQVPNDANSDTARPV
jgi:hypothetical protein